MTQVSLTVESVQADRLEELIATESLLVVDYTATWCGPCRVIAPILEQIANAFSDRLTVVKIDFEQSKASAIRHKIRSLPTVLVFKQGKEVARIIGSSAYETYRNTLAQHL
ncbi:MAG: thioredoxin [Cyanobacteria bacterium P01_G01_bin.54]